MTRFRVAVALCLTAVTLAGCGKKDDPAAQGGGPFFSKQATGNVLKGSITCNGEQVPRGSVVLLNAQKQPVGVGKITNGSYFVNDVNEGEVYFIISSDDVNLMMLMGGGRGPGGPGGPPGGPGGPPGGPPGMMGGGPGMPGGVPPGAPDMSKLPKDAPPLPKGVHLPGSFPTPEAKPAALTSQQKQLLAKIDKKYAKPESLDLKTTLKKGENIFDLVLSAP